MWADGIYSGLRSEGAKLCALVMIGVNERGEKHFLAIEDGIGESTQSWKAVLLNLKSRGLNEPELAVGDAALGFWSAIDKVFPEAGHQRCWMRKIGNVRMICLNHHKQQLSRLYIISGKLKPWRQQNKPLISL